MTTVLCHCRVADYDAWRRGYDHAVKAETQAAMEADGIDMSSLWVDYFDEVGSAQPAHE